MGSVKWLTSMPAYNGKPFRPSSALRQHKASLQVDGKWHSVPVTNVRLAQQPRSPDIYFFHKEGGAFIQLQGSAHVATHMVIAPTSARRIQTLIFLSRVSDGRVASMEAQVFMVSSP